MPYLFEGYKGSPPAGAILSLVPLNDRAKNTVVHPLNSKYRYLARTGRYFDEDIQCLALGQFFSGDVNPLTTIATMGYNGDIKVYGNDIAELHCSFDMNIDTGVVLIHDRTGGHVTTCSDENAHPTLRLDPNRGRNQVIVSRDVNHQLQLGNVFQPVVFRIVWHVGEFEALLKYANHRIKLFPRPLGGMDRTMLDLSYGGHISKSPPRENNLGIEYLGVKEIGSGGFAVVRKAVDAHTGKIFAVKSIELPKRSTEEMKQHWALLKRKTLLRELPVLAKLKHEFLLGFIDSRGWTGDCPLEIFLPLKDGSLESLARQKNMSGYNKAADLVLKQMLAALDFLAFAGYVHRDVKPGNILYQKNSDGSYHFQLADFGISNTLQRMGWAETPCGTENYYAPEIFHRDPHNSKADVWSLYVTMVWLMNTRGFRHMSFNREEHLYKFLLEAAELEPNLEQLRPMAVYDPAYRASAAMMLKNIYQGFGLSTPFDTVKRLSPDLWQNWWSRVRRGKTGYSQKVLETVGGYY